MDINSVGGGLKLRKLSFIFLTVLLFSTAASAATVDGDLIVGYRLNVSSGNSSDISGNGITGKANNILNYQVTGQQKNNGEWDTGKAFEFDGSSSWINTTKSSKFGFGSETNFTFSAWINNTAHIPHP